MIRYFHDCGGIHACGPAWDDLGFECVGISEIEKFPIAVVRHHYPNLRQYGDTTKIKGSDIPAINLLVGGTPCQGFSVAGKRGGLDDERSGLAWNFLRLAAECNPRWIIWENVPGASSTNEGQDLLAFATEVGKLGYGFAWRTLDAQYFGVPQRRRRIFLVGYFGDWRPAAAVLFESHCLRGNIAPSQKTQAGVARSLTASTGGASGKEQQHTFIGADNRPLNALAFDMLAFGEYGTGDKASTLKQRNYKDATDLVVQDYENHGQDSRIKQVELCPQLNAKAGTGGNNLPLVMQPVPINGMVIGKEAKDSDRQTTGNDEPGDKMLTLRAAENQHAVGHRGTVRRLTPLECGRLQGFPDNWCQIPWKGKPAAQRPDGPQYKAYGNAIAVVVIRKLGQRIMIVERLLTSRKLTIIHP